MTKRELIEALEALDADDGTEVEVETVDVIVPCNVVSICPEQGTILLSDIAYSLS